ncbi:hypothetical protein ACJRPK_13725 [Aquimarina sp. 2-A2]|uniref:hypothetical protein n=1 Tax=Aquimarina sp. 2-A2 TaxID=3382644 RepID=UPI00387F0B25
MAKRKVSLKTEREKLKKAMEVIGCENYAELSKKIGVSENTIKKIMAGDSLIRSGWRFALLLAIEYFKLKREFDRLKNKLEK